MRKGVLGIESDIWDDLAVDRHEKGTLLGQPEHAAEERKLGARLAELRRELGDVDPPGYAPGDPTDLK